MNVAAGVCLILAAILNLFGALGYLGGGAMTAGMGTLTEMAAEETAKQGNIEMTEAEQSQLDMTTGAVKGVGGALMAMGIFLLISVGILIAGAVFLFKGTNWKFIMAAGIVALAAELLGILVTAFGMMNVVGLVGGVLAIIAATQLSKAAEPAAA